MKCFEHWLLETAINWWSQCAKVRESSHT